MNRAYIKFKLISIWSRFYPFEAYKTNKLRKRSKYYGTDDEHGARFNDKITIGICRDIYYEHDNYITACHELQVNYIVLDLMQDNWLDQAKNSKVECLFIWPSLTQLRHKEVMESRLTLLQSELNMTVIPNLKEFWPYESKIRTRDLLKIHDLTFPNTWVFVTESDASVFIKHNETWPLVYKADQGASANGVRILKTRKSALKIIKKAFLKGIQLRNNDPFNRHKNYVIFQEYLKDCEEWRMIRIGESYFCRLKEKVGDFHSGSGEIIWAKPSEELLNLTRDVTDRLGFFSMNIDFFKAKDGTFYINELHCLFGGKEVHDPEYEGRYLYQQGKWTFEKGDFFRNRCANLRIKQALA